MTRWPYTATAAAGAVLGAATGWLAAGAGPLPPAGAGALVFLAWCAGAGFLAGRLGR